MNSITVKTKEELEKAKNDKVEEIVILGELAKQVHNGRKIISIGKIALGIITTLIVTTPFTTIFAAQIASFTGVEIALILSIIFVGIGLLLAIWKEYDEIEYSDGHLKIRRKKKTK
ncbi:MAG: hypothetical protein QMC67_13155 [Candidatus Wallbacteria bacterium]